MVLCQFFRKTYDDVAIRTLHLSYDLTQKNGSLYHGESLGRYHGDIITKLSMDWGRPWGLSRLIPLSSVNPDRAFSSVLSATEYMMWLGQPWSRAGWRSSCWLERLVTKLWCLKTCLLNKLFVSMTPEIEVQNVFKTWWIFGHLLVGSGRLVHVMHCTWCRSCTWEQ